VIGRARQLWFHEIYEKGVGAVMQVCSKVQRIMHAAYK